MKKNAFILIISILLIFTGCSIELIEKIHLNEDGSGSFEMYIDIDEFEISDFKDVVNPDIFDFLNRDIESIKEIEEIKGISNVTTYSGSSKQLIYIKFDFKNTKSLNKALYRYFTDENPVFKSNIISVSKNKIKQKDITPYIVKQYYENNDEIDLESNMRKIALNIFVTSDKDIKSVEGDEISITGTDTAQIKVAFVDLLEYEPDVSFKVKY